MPDSRQTTSGQSAAQWIWDHQSIWSQAANHAKRAIGRARATALALGVVAAVAGTAAAQTLPHNEKVGSVLAFLASTAAGLAPFATRSAGPQQLREWTRLRSVSEELKSETYRYLSRVAPYRDEDSPQILRDRVERLLADASDLAVRTHALMPRQRSLPAVTDVGSYIELRVTGQIERYYRPRAAHMYQRSAQIRRMELTLACAAAVLGAFSGAFSADWAAAWMATVTTVSAAVIAHAAASRYAYQEVEFSRTAAELERLSSRPADEHSPAADDAMVAQCEHVISVQNEGWMAKWASE
ncbi:DUF4231 domain-containing protein [Streptomyces globisporus]|uniref:DUF4231 domain-containing protein n=1 Tax=Streptomyces globisporus TaxID=1908 RepID=UPI0036FCF242